MDFMSLLICQLDSYVRESVNKVLSCSAREHGIFDVVLDDCVFYPEGGGQPCDYGTMDGYEIKNVQKHSSTPTSVRVEASCSFESGAMVRCAVDWTRRYDFMQQHTSQVLYFSLKELLYHFVLIL